MKNPLLLLVLAFLTGALNSSIFAQEGKPLYVKKDANGRNDGSSWGDAFQDLQSALDVANGNKGNDVFNIWVAKGTYYPSKDEEASPNPSDSRTKTFYIKKNMKIFGASMKKNWWPGSRTCSVTRQPEKKQRQQMTNPQKHPSLYPEPIKNGWKILKLMPGKTSPTISFPHRFWPKNSP